MKRDPEPIEAVLARHVRAGASATIEMLLFRRLSQKKRSVVERRIRVIDRYIIDRDAGSADPTVAAADIGVSVRSLYRLLARVENMSAVAALAPTRGAGRAERSDRYKGISMVVDDVIRKAVRSDPLVGPGIVHEMVSEIDPGVPYSSVRRRLLYWRTNRDPGASARFGRVWLLERAVIDIPIRRQDGRITWLPVHFLVDVDTAIVIGGRPATGGRDMVWDVFADGARRLRTLPSALPIADRVETVIWADSEPRTETVRRLVDHAVTLSTPVVFEARSLSKARRESALMQVVGAEFGPFRIFSDYFVYNETAALDGDVRPFDHSLVDLVLEEAIRRINDGALERLGSVDPDVASTEPPSVRLRRLFGTLVEVFEPVVPVAIAKAVASELDRLDDGS